MASVRSGRPEILTYLSTADPAGAASAECARAIGKEDDQVRRRLDDLVRLGLVTCERGASSGGRPPTLFSVDPRYAPVFRPIAVLDHGADAGATERPAA